MSASEGKHTRSTARAKDQLSFDHEVSMRHWSGQDPRAAAEAMGVSLSRYHARRRALELPPFLDGKAYTQDFDPDLAAHSIELAGFRKVLCRGYQARGREFYFWRHRGEPRFRSRRALALMRHQPNADSEPAGKETVTAEG